MIIPPNVNAHSYLLGRGDAERDARIRTIDGIRRAADIARHYDNKAAAVWNTEENRRECEIAAFVIRTAIRAAIGSTKS